MAPAGAGGGLTVADGKDLDRKLEPLSEEEGTLLLQVASLSTADRIYSTADHIYSTSDPICSISDRIYSTSVRI